MNNDIITAKVLRLVCAQYLVTESDLKSRKRGEMIMEAKGCCCYLMMRHGDFTEQEIGEQVSRNKSSVSAAIDGINKNLSVRVKMLDEKMKLWKAHPWHLSNRNLPNYTMKALLEQKVNKHLTAA